MKTGVCLKEVEMALEAHAKGESLVVGLSGGADSVALLHMLNKAHKSGLYAAHLNHGIRGADADADAEFVREICALWGIPLFLEQEDVPALAVREKLSLEDAARQARYSFFSRVREKTGARWVATAHHADDQAETVLMHMLRGCGLSGLCGMKMAANGILRPLLNVTRDDIMAYIEEQGLEYRTDKTNFEADYTRNRIRLELMPILRESFNPAAALSINSMAKLVSLDEELLCSLAKNALNEARLGKSIYDCARLNALHISLKSRAMRLILEENGLLYGKSRQEIEAARALLGARTGSRLRLGQGYIARVSYGELLIEQDYKPEGFCVPFSASGKTQTPDGYFSAALVQALCKNEGPLIGYFDMDKLPEGIFARRRLPGDRFFPLGAPGKKKLKDYLIDKKIPQNERDTPLLAAGQDVLFFPGGTTAQKCSVTAHTKKILRVQYFPNNG